MLLTPEDIQYEIDRRERVLKEYLESEDYQKTIKERIKIQDAGERSAEARQHIKYLCERPDDPAEGCIFFIENFGWTFNPKMSMKHFPFVLFEFQKRAIREVVEHIDKGRDIFLEKSREMGVSWLVFCYIALWYWMFREGANGLLGSYKEKLVDDRSIDSLFGKLDYALQNLPNWILPKGFVEKKHRTKLKLANPENGNVITGDTMNPNFGRGSRKTFIMFDELAFWDYAKDAWESAGDSTNCRIANSTPNGYDYYAMLRETGIDVLTLHWAEHPLKDNEWYAYECKRRTQEEIAQELDISYSKSKEGRVYPEWSEVNVSVGVYEYDDRLPLYVSWDFGKTDDTAMIWVQPSKDGLRIIDVYCNRGKNIEFYIPFVTGMVYGDITYDYTQDELKIIDAHKNWKRATHFGDPAGRFTSQTSDLSIVDTLRKYGITVNFRDNWKEFKIRKHHSKMLIMGRIFLNDNVRTKFFNMCMIQASYPVVKQNGVGIVRSDKPKHDQTSHYRSSFEYLSIGLEENAERKSAPYDKFKPRDRVSRTWGARRAVGY
jgi:hypothetical protein